MSDHLDRLAGRASDDLTRAVDAAAASAPPAAAIAQRAARRRTTHVALAVAAILTVGSTAVWSSAGGDGPSSNVVAGQPEGQRSEEANPSLDPASGNRCFRPTYLPNGFPPQLTPGPAQAGGPIAGPRDEVFHWGDGLNSINVAVADTPYPPTGETHFTVLGVNANAGVILDSGGGRTEWVAFLSCGRSWVMSATSVTDGRGVLPGELRKVAEGLVPGHPNHVDPTGVTGILFAYAPLAPDAVVPVHGPIPGSGPAAGRVVARDNDVEVTGADVPDSGRFMLILPPGDYDIVGVLENGHPCGQQRVTVLEHRVRSVIFTCQRPAEPSTGTS